MSVQDIFIFFTGYYIINVKGSFPEKFINQLIYYNIKFWDVEKISGNEIKFKILLRQFRLNYFNFIAEKVRLQYAVEKRTGFKTLINKYKNRSGLLIGIITGILIIYISTFFVWDVKIIKNDGFNESEVIELLGNLGCKVGTLKRSLDIENLQNSFIIRKDDVSFIAINLKGTVANIEIQRKAPAPEIIDETIPVNIIAAKSGKIIYIDAYEGQLEAMEGHTVNKGDLIISGIIDSDVVGYRITHAMGKVMAQTNKEIEIKIPLTGYEKIYTGNEKNVSNIHVLGRRLLFNFDFAGKFHLYEKIEDKGNIKLFNTIILPIVVNKEKYTEYRIDVKTFSDNDVKNIANNKLNDIIYNEFKNIEIISKHISEKIEDNTYVLTCSIEALEDIAKESVFEVYRKESND